MLALWALCALVVLLVPLAVVLEVLCARRHLPTTAGDPILVGLGAPAAALSAAAGVVIVRGERRNAIAWILLGSSVLLAANLAAYGYTDLALYGGEPWPGARWTAPVTNWSFVPAVFVAPALVAQLFPDGSPLPGRWRTVFALTALVGTVFTIAAMFSPAADDNTYPGLANPLATGAIGSVAGAVDGSGPVIASPVLAVAIAALIVRFRRSRGVQRQQMKWLASAGAVPVACFALAFAIQSFDSTTVVLAVLFITGFASLTLIPIAVGVAIRRYRLYEIDRLISRTLVYGSLTVVLGAAYAGLVLGGQAVFSPLAGGSNLAVAASTLIVAALFLPVRARVQGIVDRRFNRRRYDAQRTLTVFGGRVRHEVELGGLCAGLEQVVAETMQPAHISVWLRETA